MLLTDLAKRAEKFTIDNSPLILTVVGVTGTITTAYLTGQAAFRAADIIRDYKDEAQALTSFKEKVNVTWKEYIPAGAVGIITIVAIISANQIGTRRTAAIAAAYSLSDKAFNEYKEKVVEKLGQRKEESIRDELAQDRVDSNPAASRGIIVAGSGEVLCYEQFTGRYFKSSMDELKAAQNEVNARIISDNYASLSDFYDEMSLPHTSVSDEIGWNSDRLMELEFSTVLSDDGKPCIAIDYRVSPVRDYFRLH